MTAGSGGSPGLPGPPRPAWSRESVVLRLAGVEPLRDLSPEWAFAGADGAGVRVAVVDSGIDADHPALDGRVDEAGAVEFSVDPDGTVVERVGPHRDVFGHGTACAGIIHALAPQATLTSVKVLGAGLRGKVAAFLAGLRWAVDQGFDVVNLSLGASRLDSALAFHEICDDAYFKKVFVVTAANNVARTSYPSLYAAVTSVACNTARDPRRYHFNPDPPTEFLARGIDVEVPWLNGTTSTVTGNSFAAPHISGLAAQVLSKHPELRPFQLKTVLWACAANVREGGPADRAGRLTGVMHRTDARATRFATGIVRREDGHGVR
jgi:subtilisin